MITHFHILRRHRRKLLFPPGLLALAGLLWLGCVAVGRWQEILAAKTVIDLNMPLYPSHSEKPIIRFELPDSDKICKACLWSDAYFTGSPAADKREQIQVEKAVHGIMTYPERSSGIRIHFLSDSRYKHLIFVLNILAQEKIKRYWLDIHHSPTTIYAFREPLEPPKPPDASNNTFT